MGSSRSRRKRKYSFTVNQKKTSEWKKGLVEKVQQHVNEFNRLIVVKLINNRNDHIQDLRKQFRKSRFLFGKNKILQIGLGRTRDDEIDKNLHLVSQELVGQKVLLFTNDPLNDIIDFFNEYKVKTHIRPGCVAHSTITLQPGILEGFTYNQEPYLRELGLKTRVTRQGAGLGVPEVLEAKSLCVKGRRVGVKEAKLLKLLGYRDLAHFYVRLYCTWDRETQQFQRFVLKDGVMKLKDTDAASDSDEDEITSEEDVENDDDDDGIEADDDEEGPVLPSIPGMELPAAFK